MRRLIRNLRQVGYEIQTLEWQVVGPRLAAILGGTALVVVLIIGAGGTTDRRLKSGVPTLRNGATDARLKGLEQSAAENPSEVGVRNRLGQAYLDQGNFAGAATAFGEAILLDEQQFLLKGKSSDGKAVLGMAGIASRVGAPNKAAEFAKEILKDEDNRKNVAANLTLAESLTRLGKLKEAREKYEMLLKLAPDDRLVKLSASTHFYISRDFTRALDLARRASAMDRSDPIGSLLMARCREAMGEPDAAAQALGSFLDRKPASTQVAMALGQLRMRQSKLPEARAVFERGAEADPKSPLPKVMMGFTYLVESNPAEAQRQFAAALTRSDASVSARLGLAVAQSMGGNRAQAIDEYEKVLKLNPGLITALNNLAFLYAEEGKNLDRAQELAERALTRSPGSASVMDTVGWVLYRQGKYPQAIAHFQQAVKIRPKSGSIHYHLGKALLAQGNTDAGRSEVLKATQLTLEKTERDDAVRIVGGDASSL